jgi:L-lactate dehydrogenase
VLGALAQHDMPMEDFRRSIERDVRYANIAIIEGNGANQYGIGMVSARIAEIVLRDEQAVIPIGCYNPAYGVTWSVPAIVGRLVSCGSSNPQCPPTNARHCNAVPIP